MTDPRHDEPRYHDPFPGKSDPRVGRGKAAIWGWAAGVAVVVLIAFILVAGWNSNVRTASRVTPATTGAAPTTQVVPPLSTTGNGRGTPTAR